MKLYTESYSEIVEKQWCSVDEYSKSKHEVTHVSSHSRADAT